MVWIIEGFLLFREGPRIRVALLHMKMWFISNIFDRVVDLPWYRKDHLLTSFEWEEIKTIYRDIHVLLGTNYTT